MPRILIVIVLTTTALTSGCDERAMHIAREAADRQAQQNTAMAELNKEVASGSRQLVEADAEARKEIVGVHRELQAERKRLDGGWTSLEQERRQIAAQRRTESWLEPAIQLAGGVLLAVAVLAFCWFVLAGAHSASADAEFQELLIQEAAPDAPAGLLTSPHKQKEIEL